MIQIYGEKSSKIKYNNLQWPSECENADPIEFSMVE